jgi:DNA (cytosine-5)-methyltransferase 1
MNAFTFYEFFADGGMAREGLGPQWACAFANDIDARKGRSYAANFGRDGLKVGDVARLTTADLPYGAEIGPVDLAWGSPPCQDVSLAGDRAGLDETRSGAFWPFMRLMQGLRSEGRAPKMIVIENVTGLLTSHAGADFDAICDALAEASYRFGTVIIDAALLVPQSRERVFIVAVNNAIAIPASIVRTSPTAPFHSSAVIAASKRNAEYAPIWWRLPIPPLRNAVFADIIEDASTGVPWHSRADTDRLIAMMAPTHLAKLEEAQRASLSTGKRMVGGLYKRIRPEAGAKVQRAEVRFDDIAGCLRMPTGGSSRQTIVIVEGASVRSRLLSPREAARLMGLADNYRLPGNYNEAYGLMGEGVVAPVVRHLAEHILEPVLNGG